MEVNNNPIVQTSTGKIRGYKREAVYGQEFYCFESIPYAKPPLGDLRFKVSLPVEKWSDVKDCNKIANKAIQWNRYLQRVEGSEDCLYLNIYAKTLNTPNRLPVMVYIHGGGFNTGDATRLSWGPDYFMMKDVVFITIGYRLGVLGFAHFKDKSLGIPGNAGLQDVILALKWINENCQNFNGDKENITLFGHSSGSALTHMLMMSPAAKGLFHKMILMAGFVIDMPEIPNIQFRLAQYLGFQGNESNEKDLYRFFKQIDCNKLVGFNIWTDDETQRGHFYPFSPTTESFLNENSIITNEPVLMQRETWSNNLPLMMGFTSDEGLIQYSRFTANEDQYERYRRNSILLLPLKLQNLKDEKLKVKLAKQVKDLHFGNKEIIIENFQCAVENSSYNIFHSQHRILQSRLKNSPAPNFIYRFDFDSPNFNLYRRKICGPDVRGVIHADELSYIFYMPGSFKLDKNSAEFKCIEQMIECFYSFAKYSNPNNVKIQPAFWEPVKRTGIPQCLNISYDKTEIIDQPEYEKCCIRDEIYRKACILLY